MKYPIPDDALDDRLGFTGVSGSGKSYNAGGAVERVLARGARVVTIDPLGVWYGLRLLADGKTPSPHDVVIFGGPHGDLPITEHAGALIAVNASRNHAFRGAKRKILVADLLCGAGGSSTGCARALHELSLEMELVCVNHWPLAIETHKKNHPEARHYVQDIGTVRPHLLVPEGYLDLLMASPTCTHHSIARGGKPTSDQQRSDPWHIITWLRELRVKRIIIENVWEFIGWGPVDPRSGNRLNPAPANTSTLGLIPSGASDSNRNGGNSMLPTMAMPPRAGVSS